MKIITPAQGLLELSKVPWVTAGLKHVHGQAPAWSRCSAQWALLHVFCATNNPYCVAQERNPELFDLARVGLGALGIVAEMTLQCVPAHRLVEHTFATTRKVFVCADMVSLSLRACVYAYTTAAMRGLWKGQRHRLSMHD